MSEFEQLLPKEFHASPGVEDWRVLFWGAHVFYRTSSFDQAAEFVSAIAEAARTVGHDPDVDVGRRASRSEPAHGLTEP